MKKFTRRESYLLIEAINSQRNAMNKQIKAAQKKGKHLLFTERFVDMEHDNLVELITGNTKKETKKWKH